jgi:TPP-dependent pyruvate/acetoin dehydrogenase alpha subunit
MPFGLLPREVVGTMPHEDRGPGSHRRSQAGLRDVNERVMDDPRSLDTLESGRLDRALRFYEQALTIRRAEETLLELYAEGEIMGTLHTCVGQEICAVGVVGALDPKRDVVFSSHRAHGHFLAYCDDLEGLIGEIMGRSRGVCSGIGGTQHLHYGNLYTNGIQGGIVPCAAGASLAEKMLGTGAIVAVFLGDGTMGEGVVYETMNVASLWSLPLLFVLENNHYAQTTPAAEAHSGILADRARPFGIRSEHLSADDFSEVYVASLKAVDYVRARQKPFFLSLDTYRLNAHSKGDDTRDPEEIRAHWSRDPLTRLEASLPTHASERIRSRVAARIADVVGRLRAADLSDWATFSERAGL